MRMTRRVLYGQGRADSEEIQECFVFGGALWFLMIVSKVLILDSPF